MKDIKDDVCDRADDLIAFLYHELGEKEARNFERHLHECTGCESEVASFGQIRESIVSWRDASLSAAWSAGAVPDRQVAPTAIARSTPIRPSALAAIREFFSLSPLWMKGAAAFASLLFCVCAVLAVAYLKNRNSEVVKSPSDRIYSKQELDNAVARAVLMNQAAKEPGSELVSGSAQSKATNRVNPLRTAGYVANTQGLRKPLTRQERRELAADLGLLASRDEDDLELVTDRITQAP
jgi:anti-sigma factor RsiW